MSAASIRQATLADARDIYAVLSAVAEEIPVQLNTLTREEALYALVRTCARSGESWVCCSEDGRIVGMVLAELSQRGRHYAEHEVIELHYAAALPSHDREVILEQLLGQVLSRLVPVLAAVPMHNRFGLAACLERLGFRPGEGGWRHEPGAR